MPKKNLRNNDPGFYGFGPFGNIIGKKSDVKEVEIDQFGNPVGKKRPAEVTPDNSPSQQRPRTGPPVPNLPSSGDIDMGDTGGEPEQPANNALALRAGGGDQTRGAHETPVIWHSPEYGFKETMTVVIPTTLYFSVNKLPTTVLTSGDIDKNKVEIRLNSPYTPLMSTLVAQSTSSPVAVGVSATKAPDSATNPSTLLTFPYTITSSHKPQWLSYWDKMYEVYTVLETQYEITIANARTASFNHSIVCWERDQYGTSSTGNIMPAGPLDEMINWRGVKEGVISGQDYEQRSSFFKISETWKPGQENRNATNDGDVKTWCATGAVPSPAYVESLHMRFFASPFTQDTHHGVNVEVRLKYIVQFKDLKSVFRYPITGGSGITLTVPDNVLNTD